MPKYCVTIQHGIFEIEAEDETDAREIACDKAEIDIELDEDEEEEEAEEDDD